VRSQQPINLREVAAYNLQVLWSPQPYCLLLGDVAGRNQRVAVVPRKSNNDVSLFVCNVHDGEVRSGESSDTPTELCPHEDNAFIIKLERTPSFLAILLVVAFNDHTRDDTDFTCGVLPQCASKFFLQDTNVWFHITICPQRNNSPKYEPKKPRYAPRWPGLICISCQY
jgi:hypothetical protein